MSDEEIKEQTEETSETEEKVEDSSAEESDVSSSSEEASGEEVKDSNEARLSELEKEVERLKKENDELKDKYLRSVADFQNLRKRSAQEKQDAYDYANTSLLKDLLDSLDNFDRTVEAATSASDAKSIAEGVTMINKGMVSMLENKYNLVSYGAVGDAFDPDIHEAIGKSDEPVASPVLKAVYLKGYRLKDRVIRHAKVMVSMPDGSVAAEENKTSE